MADIEIAGNKLIVHIRGADKFFALASRLCQVPLLNQFLQWTTE